MPLSNENFKKQKQHEMKTTFNNRDKEYYLFICNECDHKIQKTQISKCNYCRTPLVLHDNKQWKEQLAHQKAFINEHTGNYYLFLCQNCINKNNILGGKIKNLSKISKIVEYSAVLLFIISLIISFLVFNYSSLIHWLSFGFGLILLVFSSLINIFMASLYSKVWVVRRTIIKKEFKTEIIEYGSAFIFILINIILTFTKK